MAGKTDAAKGKGKGAAFAKWAKIDKAQRNMFLAVCGASVILGVTIVAIVYSVKVISFNAKLIGEKDKIIKDYTTIQSNLESISTQVNEMTNNEKLEVVARNRASDCSTITTSKMEKFDISEIELARTCSALRIIPDALPSLGNLEATSASMNQLLLWSDPSLNIEGISVADVSEYPMGNSNNDGNEGEEILQDENVSSDSTLQPIGVSVAIEDESNKVRRALDTIERSVRNFDIMSASIEFSGGIEDDDGEYIPEKISLSAIFRAYYSKEVSIEKKSKKICADDASEGCKKGKVTK